ncbi:hypothetical protein Plhal304r1_c078g0164701 [Plasmopara halstedii]
MCDGPIVRNIEVPWEMAVKFIQFEFCNRGIVRIVCLSSLPSARDLLDSPNRRHVKGSARQ